MNDLPTMIATDLDGTVVRHDLTVSERTTKVLSELQRRGVIIVGATGRGPRLRDLTYEELPAARWLVMGGGCFVFENLGTELVTHRSTMMSGRDAERAVKLVEAETGPLKVVVENDPTTSAPLVGDVIPDWPFPVPILSVDRGVALQGDIVKAFIRSDTIPPPQLLKLARQAVPEDLAALTDAGVGNVEVCPSGIYKDTGVAQVAQQCGVAAEDVLVFGDATNDLPMFAWAGRAVAVGNAAVEVRQAADEVIDPVAEDGVAKYLERLFDL